MASNLSTDQIASLFVVGHVDEPWYSLSPKQAAWLFGQARREGRLINRNRTHRYGNGAGGASVFSIIRGTLSNGETYAASNAINRIRIGDGAGDNW